MTFLLATKNRHKLDEMARILAPLGVTLCCEDDLPHPLPEVEETGTTFAQNAFLKAQSAMLASGLPAIADDSGLCVDALNGAPGVYSARFAGEPTDSAANNAKLLSCLRDVDRPDRTARFVCTVVCVFPDGKTVSAEGVCEGEIAFAPQGDGGFGYDPLFLSKAGCFATLTPAQKDAVSHRGRALRAFAQNLNAFFREESASC